MWEALRHRLAMRAALGAVRARPAPAPLPPLAARRLLAVLPGHADREVWDLLGRVGLPPAQMHLVALGPASPPDRFAGAVAVVSDAERDWRGLPPRAVREAAAAFRPDVALSLIAPDDPAGLWLVGASAAAVRVARHDLRTEAAYDLFVTAAAPRGGPAPAALAAVLGALDPPLVPTHGRPAR